MIPKRAFFYWEGPPISWLRAEGVASFHRLHPDWEIVMLDSEGIFLTGDDYLDNIHRSDIARYKALFKIGGVYFDTDQIFLKRIPDEWLDADLLLPHTQENTFTQVAMLGSVPGTQFFKVAYQLAMSEATSGRNLGYQALGVATLSRCLSFLSGHSVRWYPSYTNIPISWTRLDLVWNATTDALHPDCYAFHWFGGDPLSRHMEPKVDREWVLSSDSAIAKVVKMSWALTSGDHAALRNEIPV